MKHLSWILLFFLLTSCKKIANQAQTSNCDMTAIKKSNSSKVSISSGIWGTVSLIQGNCMPTTDKNSTSCSECPIKREVRIYNYTTIQDAEPATVIGLYNSFKTQLIKTVFTDDQGFFQAEVPDGKYTVVFVENGKLYATNFDGQNGISSATVQHAKVNVNLLLNKAVY